MFTSFGHLKRDKCCGSGCRHCPFQHVRLKDKTKIQRPAWLVKPVNGAAAAAGGSSAEGSAEAPKPRLDVLFWSGGKDSFLALRALLREDNQVCAIATSDAAGIAGH